MSDFVFARILDESFQTSKHINHYFEKFDVYNSNVYQILNQIPQSNLIIYIFIISFIFFLLSFYEIKLNHILTFLLSIVIIGYLIQKDFGDFNKYISDKKTQLKFINKLCFDGNNWRNYGTNNDMMIQPHVKESYLYLNPLIVDLFYNIRQLTQINLSAYVSTVLHTNNVIGLHEQMKRGVIDPFSNLDVGKNEMTKALNSLESMIYNIHVNHIIQNKIFTNSVHVLQSILTRYIQEMEDICERQNKKDGLNVYSKPNDQLDSSFMVSPNDTKTSDYNPSYNLFVE